MLNPQKKSALLVLFLSVFFLVFFYHDVLFSPNDYLFSEGGDGIKNYFTYLSKISDDKIIASKMMNYPYGESFLYLDCHPVLVAFFNVVNNVFPGVSNYGVGIVNFLMLSSLVLSAYFVYLVLVEYKVNYYYAAIAAIGSTVLNPQIYRFLGHLALSYSFFIPLTWYLYIRYTKTVKKFEWSIVIMINILFWYFIHAYMGMILVAFLFSANVFQILITERESLKNWKRYMQLSLQTIVPLLIFWVFALVTDTHVGRTTNPFGFMEYISNFDSVFFPSKAPFFDFFNSRFKIIQIWEGLAYVGVGSILLVTIYFGRLIMKKWRGEALNLSQTKNKELLFVLLPASVLVLLVSFGWPFVFGLEDLLDAFPVIKNFRGVGRFSWVFFNVFTVASVVIAYSFFESSKKSLVYKVLLVLLPLSFVIEGIPYHKEVSEKINVSKNLFKKSQLDTSFQTLFSQIDASKYQAIIPLPFYHTGSENFAKFGTDKMYTFSMVAAYHLSLPLTSNYTTRTSILESKNVLEILAPNYYYKDIESEIKSEKPFLVLYDNEYLNDYETDLLNKSVKIASSGDYSFYSISKSVLFESSNKKEIDEFKKLRPSLVEKKFCLIAPQDTSKYFDVKTFESTLTTVARTGKGSLTGFMKDYTTIATVEKGLLEVDQEYNVGLWIRNTGENYGQDMINAMLIVQSEDPSGAIEWVKIANPNESFINEGDWSYVEVKFWCKDSNNKYSVVLKGNDKLKHKFFIDDFIIRDQRLTLYRDVKTSQEGLLSVQKNNHYIVENK